jgi:hypothetical protein
LSKESSSRAASRMVRVRVSSGVVEKRRAVGRGLVAWAWRHALLSCAAAGPLVVHHACALSSLAANTQEESACPNWCGMVYREVRPHISIEKGAKVFFVAKCTNAMYPLRNKR